MVIVKNRELLFSDREQYIGTTYDNNSEVRLFSIDRLAAGGIDIAGLTFRLDLKYNNDALDSCLLDKQVPDDKILLTWTVTNSVLQVPGPIFVNIRGTDSGGAVKWSSYQAVVYSELSLNTPGTYTGNLTELEQLELRIDEKYTSLDANESERQSNEAKRQQDTAAAIQTAEAATNRAVTGAKGAESAMNRAVEAAQGVEKATQRANIAAGHTESAIETANMAAQAANIAAGDVNTAKAQAVEAAKAANLAASSADTKAQAAETAVTAANTAAENADTKAQAADTATIAANTAATAANAAAGDVNTAKDNANTAATAANAAAGDVNTAKDNANTAATAANTAAGNANAKAGIADSAATSANTAAGYAQTQANYAKTQGDYAKEQGDAAAIVAQGAVAQNGGDLSNTVLATFEPALDDFPVPEAGEKTKTLFGKIKKFIDDFKALKASLVLVGQIINTFDRTAEGSVADGRALKTLKDLIDTNSASITNLVGQVLMANAISNTQVDAVNRVPSSSLAYLMQQSINQNKDKITQLNSEFGKTGILLISNPESLYQTTVDQAYTLCSLPLPKGKWLLIGSTLASGDLSITGADHASISRGYRTATEGEKTVSTTAYATGGKTVSLQLLARMISSTVHADPAYCYLKAIKIG